MKLYIASSWENARYPLVVNRLRQCGHDVFDFKNSQGATGRRVEEEFVGSDQNQFLAHQDVKVVFKRDFRAMEAAGACILVLPSGRSSHLEAGWFVGKGKPCFILLDPVIITPLELMYGMATVVTKELGHIIDCIQTLDAGKHLPTASYSTPSEKR